MFNEVLNYLSGIISKITEIEMLMERGILLFVVLVLYFLSRRFIPGIISRNKFIQRIGESNSTSLKRFIIVFITITFTGAALQILGFDIVQIVNFRLIRTESVSISLYHLIILYLIIFITKIIIYTIESVIIENTKSGKEYTGKSRSLLQIVKYIIYVIAFALFIQSLGFSVTFFIASISALLVGLGLGIQHIFDDIISGIILLFDGSLKMDDIIEIEGKVVGKVLNIGIRTTEIMTRDSVVMIVPNSMFTTGKIINWSHHQEITRFDVKIGTAYGSNVSLVKNILIKCAAGTPGVATEPPPEVLFDDFGESSLNFRLLFWSMDSFNAEFIKSNIRFMIENEFRQNGIKIPFKQVDVYINPQ